MRYCEKYTTRLSAGVRHEYQYTHTPLPPSVLTLLLVNHDTSDEFQSWFFTQNTFIFACYPSEILSGAVLPTAAIARMQLVQFCGPALTMEGDYEMEDTSQQLGDFSANWGSIHFATQNQAWLRIFDFMENQMKDFRFVGLEIARSICYSENKMTVGHCYLWHVTRKMATMWRGGHIQRLSIFNPTFRIHRSDQKNLVSSAEENVIVKVMRFD